MVRSPKSLVHRLLWERIENMLKESFKKLIDNILKKVLLISVILEILVIIAVIIFLLWVRLRRPQEWTDKSWEYGFGLLIGILLPFAYKIIFFLSLGGIIAGAICLVKSKIKDLYVMGEMIFNFLLLFLIPLLLSVILKLQFWPLLKILMTPFRSD